MLAATVNGFRIEGNRRLPDHFCGGVIAIGNFDGVHRGHHAVLDRALTLAEDRKVQSLVLTFEPHPRTFFRPQSPVFRLTPPALRAELLAASGFAGVIEMPFNHELAQMSAADFVSTVLAGQLGAKAVVTGHDFHFGRERLGTPAFLARSGPKAGMDVVLVPPFRDEAGGVISSTAIREALGEGDLDRANALLGWTWRVSAGVTRGKQLGRTLGYPTANMELPAETALAHGIYAVRFRRADGTWHDGVASFGRRPTVDEDGAPLLETFLFDFSGDLYGETCMVALVARLRGEEKFDSLDALVAQMKTDEAQARAILRARGPASALDAALDAGAH